ncbi:MAG: glycoside hydrolase family 3 C-terminal domain-containing protein, partial [Oscillospiraceae bacterium]|nr:glycoside hydrolase family 3 C-terminal domain-containing protein [Oscillospiraceae bacterium]
AALSCVLLKNEDDILPLKAGEKIAVVGLMAAKPRYQGAGSSLINPTRVDNALDELIACGLDVTFVEGYNPDGSTNSRLITDAREAAENADKVICFIGLPDSAESEGFDRSDMQLPEGMLKLVDSLLMTNKNTVVTLSLGAPVELPFAPRVKALLLGYLGGQAGGSGMADVLTGRVTPGGKLAESWPKKLADTPCFKYFAPNRRSVEYREGLYVGYRYYQAAALEPAFCFGEGLSYTRFRIGSCSVDTAKIDDEVNFSCIIENIGGCSGSETVQLYSGYSSLGYRQLVGFERVYLQPGERRAVTITLK